MTMFNKIAGFNQQQGFTLIEVLTVMLVLTAVAAVTVETASTLAFQGRYEVTKDRYEKIKKAIIGDPNQIVNGQPDTSGFVADMGRLPENIRELTQVFYCTDAGGVVLGYRRPSLCTGANVHNYSSTSCLNPNYTDKTSCTGGGSIWLGQEIDTSGLTYGWNGPYLKTTKNPAANTAFIDGWGNTNDTINYGWNFCLGDNPVITTPTTCYSSTYPIAGTNNLDINSKGKDQVNGGTDTYDLDYPDSTLFTVAFDDWGINPNNQIAVHIPSALSGACDRPVCDDPRFTVSSCANPRSEWFTGSCSDGTTRNQAFCASPNTWTPISPGCNNAFYLTLNDCTAPNGTVQPAASVSQENCKAGGGIWTNQQISLFARLRYHSVDANGQTQIIANDSPDIPYSFDGNAQTLTLGGFPVTRIPMGKAELSIIARISVGGVPTPVLFSGICKSNNATPLADCATVGGNYDVNTKLCFNSDPATCTSAHNAILIYPVKSPVQLNISPNATLPAINW